MVELNIARAEAVVRVDLGGEFSYRQIKDMVRAVCSSGEGTTFFETTVTAPGSDKESPVLGQHSTSPTNNLFVTPDMSSPSFDRDATYSSLTVIGHEQAEWGQVVHAVRVYPWERGQHASDLAQRLWRAFDRGINDFEARNAALAHQNAADVTPGRSDGAQDRRFGRRPGAAGRAFGR
jgi:hypothetical protein